MSKDDKRLDGMLENFSRSGLWYILKKLDGDSLIAERGGYRNATARMIAWAIIQKVKDSNKLKMKKLDEAIESCFDRGSFIAKATER